MVNEGCNFILETPVGLKASGEGGILEVSQNPEKNQSNQGTFLVK